MKRLPQGGAQLSLPGEAFEPAPSGRAHYVPCIQMRAGELSALEHASAEDWSAMTPLVRVVGPRRQADNSGSRVTAWAKRLSEALGPHAFYVDVDRVPALRRFPTSVGEQSLLALLHDGLWRRDAPFVPVLRFGQKDSMALGEVCRVAADRAGRGLAMRVPYMSLVAAPSCSLGQDAANLIRSLEIDSETCDIILDGGYLDPDISVSPEFVVQTIRGFEEAANWRRFVLMGTSMPAQLGGVVKEGTLGSIPRGELALFSGVEAILGSRAPIYGDYAVQHPRPPVEPGGPGMRNNVRYTGLSSTLIARGSGSAMQQSRTQYVELCDWLVKSEEFAGADFSWGDSLIARCRDGALRPGSQSMWRGAGTSHHLKRVLAERRNCAKS